MFGTPALRALRQRFRDACISVITWQSSCEVLRGNPNIDRLFPCNGTLDMAKTVSRLKAEGIDLVVGLSHVGSWLSAAFPGALKVGFNSKRLGWLYAEPVPDTRTVHAIDYCLQVVRSVGAVPDSRRLEFHISDKDRETAANWASAQGVSWRRTAVSIHPGGRNFTAKRWRTSGFAAVADRLVEELGAEVIIVGGTDDVPLAQSIADQVRSRVFIAAGHLSLKQTGALIERCSLFIGNDSAPQHIASAVDTPVVALFGPTDPDNFGPSSSLSSVVTAGLPCSPCFHWMASPLQYLYLSSVKRLECRHECMSEISPDQVMSAAHQLLDRARQRSAAGTGRKLTAVRCE